MRRLLAFTVIAVSTFAIARIAVAHCEVPCGVYGDQRRFETMLEDTETIAKGLDQINQLASRSDATSKNQLTRWVNTKEEHATNTQKIIAQYFMTQRIKPGSDGYVAKLSSAHAVMVAAMKCKQTADPASAAALKKSIYAFYEAYEGKKPNFE